MKKKHGYFLKNELKNSEDQHKEQSLTWNSEYSSMNRTLG